MSKWLNGSGASPPPRRRLFGESAQAEQGVGVGVVAAEALEEHHGVFCVAGLKYVLLEAGGSLLVEYALLLEKFPCVSLKHLCPKISVIARSITVLSLIHI